MQKDQAVVLLGHTGSGKTTIGLFLSGVRLIQSYQYGEHSVEVMNKNEDLPNIGHSIGSETQLTEVIINKINIIDFPAFDITNKNSQKEDLNTYLDQVIMHKIQSIRVVLVFNWRNIIESFEFQEFIQYLQQKLRIIGIQENLKFSVIINKCDVDTSEKDKLIDYIQKKVKEQVGSDKSQRLFIQQFQQAQFYFFTEATEENHPFETYGQSQFTKWILNSPLIQIQPFQNKLLQNKFNQSYQNYIEIAQLMMTQEIKQYNKQYDEQNFEQFKDQGLQELIQLQGNLIAEKYQYKKFIVIYELKEYSQDIYEKHFQLNRVDLLTCQQILQSIVTKFEQQQAECQKSLVKDSCLLQSRVQQLAKVLKNIVEISQYLGRFLDYILNKIQRTTLYNIFIIQKAKKLYGKELSIYQSLFNDFVNYSDKKYDLSQSLNLYCNLSQLRNILKVYFQQVENQQQHLQKDEFKQHYIIMVQMQDYVKKFSQNIDSQIMDIIRITGEIDDIEIKFHATNIFPEKVQEDVRDHINQLYKVKQILSKQINIYVDVANKYLQNIKL
ncbi:hypothetical protein pb186bvf_001050 [Paramecium bursaria]